MNYHFVSGWCLGWMMGALFFAAWMWTFASPWSPRHKRRDWREKAKELDAAVIRAKFLDDEPGVRRAEADRMAHACVEPDPTFLQRLAQRRAG